MTLIIKKPTSGKLVMAKGQPVPVDLQGFGSVSLLLRGNGVNGSTTITDSCLTPSTVTAVGNAQISTAQSKFGGASIYVDGINSRVTIPGNAKYTMPGDFTVELWVYQISSSSLLTWLEFGNTNFVEKGILMRHNQISVGSSGSTVANPALTNNQWTHLAVVRSGSTLVVYKNGTSIGSGTSTDTLTASSGIWLGDCISAPGRYWNGYIDELRITKGIARYTSNFTPQTVEFPSI